MILDARANHNHEIDEERTIQRQKLRQECKKRALEDITERPHEIIITEAGKMENSASDRLLPADVSSVRQSVYRVRRKTQPKLTKSREETHQSLNDCNLESTNGEE
jgi:hypothetical protein